VFSISKSNNLTSFFINKEKKKQEEKNKEKKSKERKSITDEEWNEEGMYSYLFSHHYIMRYTYIVV